MLRISQRTVERYADPDEGQGEGGEHRRHRRRHPGPARLRRAGRFDERGPGVRHLTVALPPRHAARLFEAQEQGAGDDRLREIAAEALKETYFQDGGRRAGSLEEVHFTDIEHLEFDL